MSGLTGYLTSSGVDLSSVFLSSDRCTFASAIQTNAGIISPPTNLTYTPDMIGYTLKVVGAKSPNSTVSSGAATSLSGTTSFTIQTGLYIANLYVSNTYSGGPGTLNFLNICISTSSSSFSGPVYTFIGTVDIIPNTGFIEGGVNLFLKVSTPTPYYLVENVNFSGLTVTTVALSSYVQYTRIA